MKSVAGSNIANCLLFLLVFLCFTLPGKSQARLPEGKGEELVQTVCTQCHGLDRLVNANLTAQQWQDIVYDMVARGAPLMRDEMEIVTQYLVENFAKKKASAGVQKSVPEPMPTWNRGNRKNRRELEGVSVFSARKVAALTGYREESGDIANREELTKVPGRVVKRLEENKEQLAFYIWKGQAEAGTAQRILQGGSPCAT